MADFTREELQRYSRHLVLKEFGYNSQLKLKNSNVLVVGAGGLGCPALQYLTAAGVGTIGVVDQDTISHSNLQRQILYTSIDIGKPKAEVAIQKLEQLNPHVRFILHNTRITSANALQILGDYDLIIDGTDNFPTRYLLNDACILLDKPLVFGSILEFEGHVAVFNVKKEDGSHSANYRDLFPEPPGQQYVPNCEEAGVLGALPGIIGSMQAIEAIKTLTGIGTPLINKLLLIDCTTMNHTIINIPDRKTRQSVTALIDYDFFCGISHKKNKSLNSNTNIKAMKEITVKELQQLQESGADFQLIDVREPYEYDICNIGGELIPMSEVPKKVDRIAQDKQVIMHCRSGKRSGDMIHWLEKNHDLTNLYNLKGGILAWANEIDPEMPTY